jgi:hypothetical protein
MKWPRADVTCVLYAAVAPQLRDSQGAKEASVVFGPVRLLLPKATGVARSASFSLGSLCR